MRIARATVVIALWCLLRPLSAEACSCASGTPLCRVVWTASSVVEATVSSIEITTGAPGRENSPPFRARLAHLKDVRVITGESIDVVATGFGGGDCGYDFQVGTRYLIVAHKGSPDDRATTGICSPTQPASWSSPFKSYLEGLSKPSRGATLSGDVQLLRGSLDFSQKRNEPVAGARVVLTGPVQLTAASDDDGEFKFEQLPAGQYTLSADVPAGRSFLAPIQPKALTILNTHACPAVTLTTAVNGLIEGIVVDEAGRAVRGAALNLRQVEPRNAWQPDYRFARSDDTGSFRFDRLPAGSYKVGVNLHEGPTRDSPFAVAYGRLVSGATPEIITLEAGARQALSPILVRRLMPAIVTGEVRLDDGRLVAGAAISVTALGEQRRSVVHLTAKSDEQGKFAIELLQGASYSLEVRFQRFFADSVQVTAGATSDPLVVTVKTRRD
jgi:hypothetical protein